MSKELTAHEKFVAQAVMPAVHMNGNSRESLINEWTNFAIKLQDAMEAFPFESFHGRNHYIRPMNDQENLSTGREVIQKGIQSIIRISETVGSKLMEDQI